MKTFLRALPVVLSALVLAAHFFRSRQLPLVAVSLALPLLLLVRERWSARVVQAGLVLGALEWVRTLPSLPVSEWTWGGRGEGWPSSWAPWRR